MLGETQLAAALRVQSSQRRSQFDELLELSFPRNCIVKVILNKSDKATVNGSQKLLPDIHNFYQVLWSGPTSVQVRNISDGRVKTNRKTSISLVSFAERQCAVRLLRENFPKALLWEHNQFHRKQNYTKYVFNSTIKTKKNVRKSVTFSPDSTYIDLDYLISIENQFLVRYHDFSGFPKFLKSNHILHPHICKTKNHFEVYNVVTPIQTLLSCPCTSAKEIGLLFN